MVFLFAGIGGLQYWFVRAQLYQTTRHELRGWAVQIAQEIAYKDKWDLGGYRRAAIAAPNWCVVAKDGLVIDVEGLVPGLLGPTTFPNEAVYSSPQTVVTTTRETWRVFGKMVRGGTVMIGWLSPEHLAASDAKLAANMAKFGDTLATAASVRSRELDADLDYAVLSANGEIEVARGGIPLQTDRHLVPAPSDRLVRRVLNGKAYLLWIEPIRSASGGEAGTVIVTKDMSLQEQALRSLGKFNLWVVGLSTLVTCALAINLVVQELLSQTSSLPLEEALRTGESGVVEFKSSFQWDLRRNQYVEERRLDVLKAIAGFLNAKGGTLYIGVSEETDPPQLRGLDEDLKYAGGSRDKLQRTLRDLITTRIGPEFSPLIAASLDETAGRLCWTLAVQESPEPAFVRWKFTGESKEQKKFYVREGPKTSDLDNERTWHYIKNKWG
jgi:hypothetical protein